MDDFSARKRLEACFGGLIDRECADCPLYYANGGGCCFSQKFDAADKECVGCIHSDNCAELCDKHDPWTAPSRTAYTGSRYMVRPRTVAPAAPMSSVYAPATTSIARRDVGPARIATESNMERFVKDSVWSAGEGFFKGALEFFRGHRWR